MTTITRKNIESIKGIVLHRSLKNADGSPMRFKINGKIKLWKTRPEEFKVPIKHGLYEHSYLTNINCSEFYIKDVECLEENCKECHTLACEPEEDYCSSGDYDLEE